MTPRAATQPPLCPSAPPDPENGVLFGLVTGTAQAPRVRYLPQPEPIRDAYLQMADPVDPTEVFRFAAPCARASCMHYENSSCRLASRVVEGLPESVDKLPPCVIRPHCRWWLQEGKAACLRCPGIVTRMYAPSEEQVSVAYPQVPTEVDRNPILVGA